MSLENLTSADSAPLLSISRSSVYYKPRGESAENLALMRRMDALSVDSSFCVDALEAALQMGTPDIFNTDQGSQFTSTAFTERVRAAGAQCSMDGHGRCLDNVFIKRLWRSLKYEAVYLNELADGFAAERVIAAWMTFSGYERPHSLGGRTPAEVSGEERAA